MNEHSYDLLPWFAAGTLAADERDRVQQHIAGCATCQRELEQWQVIAQAVNADVSEQAIALSREAEHQMPSISLTLSRTNSRKGTSSMSTPLSPPKPEASSRRASFSLAALLLAILIVISVGWFGFAHRVGNGNNAAHGSSATVVATPAPAPTYTSLVIEPVHAAVTVHSVTVSVEAVTLASDRTTIFYTTHSTNKAGGFALDNASLEDGAGHFIGVEGASSGTTDAASMNYSGVIRADPLPADEQNKPQTLTLIVDYLTYNNGSMNTLNGPWKITFATGNATVQHATAMPNAVTHHGITVQVINAAVIGPNSQSGGYPGALFLYVRTSSNSHDGNCPAVFPGEKYTDKTMLPGFQTSPIHLTTSDGHAIDAPIFKIDTNNITLPNDPIGLCVGRKSPYTQDQQIIFVGTFTKGTAQVTIPELLLGPDGEPPYHVVSGPWTFQIPIN